MTKLNRNYAKKELKQDGTPDYAPLVVRVPTHHHEEWDEQIFDPETGEPTGETEHRSRDWTTYETKLKPTAKDYAACGYVPVVDRFPEEPAPTGYHYQASGWEAAEDAICRVYVLVANPPVPSRTFVTADLVEALMEEDVWEQAREWISEQGLLDLVLATNEFDETNKNFVAGRAALQTALGWTDAKVEELLSKCVKI